ncbi:SoxR reducing system RseC family protein [Cereibacter sphaeroides]|uniref:SoxR reducing system RseC family protein n=2 Tax=Cereibacter sphaeroides TaxID=1063 RepID=UPI001E418AE7|nr:SoxR reducing system RseC family protein [Cereibacter sphaeroides]
MPSSSTTSCCGARGACGGAAASGPARLLEIACPPDLAPRPGDEVEVALSGGRFLAAVGLAYLLPTLAVVIAAGAGLALQLSDLGVALLCLPALALSLIPLALAGRGEGLTEALRVEALHPAGPSEPDPCGP